MTDPRHTQPPRNRSAGSGQMWAWLAGGLVVILVVFALAAGWTNDPQTAINPPPATVGSGGTTMPPSTADRGAPNSYTTGSGASDSGTTGSAATPSEPDNPNASGQ